MKLTESKSSLVNLMSNEQIIVEQRNVDTAFFDPETRLLVVPEFSDDVSVNVLDLMLSHEVGHALYTNSKKWTDAIKEGVNKSILNVVEDNRIERLIKQKYPGLKKIYFSGYKELMNNDFFGLSKIDKETINLVDKINLYSKIGFLEFLTFDVEEQTLLHKVDSTKTFEDVVRVSKELESYVKEKLEQEYENLKSNENGFEFDGETDFERLDSFFQEESVEKNTEEFPSKGGSEGDDSDLEEDSDSEDSIGSELGSLQDYIDEQLKSYTQESSEKNIRELYKDVNRLSLYVDIPDIKLSEYIVDYSVILQKLESEVLVENVDFASYSKFKKENASVISYVIKEFNLKKNAKGRKKIKIAKTGELNLNKLYNYRIAEDIFKRSTITPKAQSHGLVFFLDWSGSMTRVLNETIKQLLVLLTFCKKCNIPFEVYAFTTEYYDKQPRKPRRENEIILNVFRLMNLFSSRMHNNDYIKMCNYLLSFDGSRIKKHDQQYTYYDTKYYNSFVPQWFKLGNTPLNHAILISDKIMKEFKERSKVQIVNSIYLTDGDSHGVAVSTMRNGYMSEMSINQRYGMTFYLRDKKSKETLKFKCYGNGFKETNQIVSFVKQFSDFRMFAFRLIDLRDLKRNYSKIESSYGKSLDTKTFNKDNCLEASTSFDKFYFVKTNITSFSSDLENLDGKNVSTIAKDFSKSLNNKINTKVFLTKFIEFIQ